MSYHFNKCLLFSNFCFASLCDFKDPPPLGRQWFCLVWTPSLLLAINIYGFSSDTVPVSAEQGLTDMK